MENIFKIKNRNIGINHTPLVIAEIGINHGGSLKEAMLIAKEAIKSGIEVIKHQTHIISDEMSNEAKKVIPGNSEKSIYEIMNQCSLSEKEEKELKDYIESENVIFISTPFSRKAADRLEKMNVPAYKIGSGECNNYPLIEHVAQFKKPIILSTGMNNINTIKVAVEIIEKYELPYALLHTTNIYPTPNNLSRLGAINEIKKNFPKAVIGLSDHSLTNHACFGAVALGASILERHFTDSKKRSGPDIICSMDGNEAKELIKGANIIFEQRGGNKQPVKEEEVTMNFAFATVVTIQNIKKGETLNKNNIWVKRPGTGEIKAIDFNKLIGKKINKDIPNDYHLKWNDVTE